MLIGWDIGGAHVKAALWRPQAGGWALADVVQWPCPLWLGLDRLQAVLHTAAARWPGLADAAHALTMSGEMADGFADRRAGVQAIAEALRAAVGAAPESGRLALFCGPGDWCPAAGAAARWADIASANWLATAADAAAQVGDGLLVDIGSTTTDLIPLRGRRPAPIGRTDAGRLASGELVYHGVVRTPLCVLGPSVPWQGRPVRVMNEWFATSADVYRLTGELAAAHDQQPTADQGPATADGSRARLARLIGLDAADGTAAQWLALARALRDRQVALIADGLAQRLGEAAADDTAAAGARPPGCVVTAGCGAFLVPDVLRAAGGPALSGWPLRPHANLDGRTPAALADWAGVCAPAVAVGRLRAQAL